MRSSFVRRSTQLLTAVAAVTALAACEDARVKAVDTGMTRDQAISMLGKDAEGAGPDSMPNVYKRSNYLVNGQEYEVLYFTKHNEKQTRDTVPWEDLTPVVLQNNRVIGKGWAFWDSAGKSLRIEVPKHQD
ncbi:MAG TPA: hypothetical protein VEA99_14690 [Gemmatimonadaceae bacterium]|nr:hypothetical protein [Gemmatimonadaceae bacterium]